MLQSGAEAALRPAALLRHKYNACEELQTSAITLPHYFMRFQTRKQRQNEVEVNQRFLSRTEESQTGECDARVPAAQGTSKCAFSP